MEEKIVKKVQRNNHLTHLANVAPLIVIAYGIQCWLIATFFPDQKLSHFAMPLALSLVIMMGALVVYDTFGKFNMYESYMHLSFGPLNKIVHYNDIEEVEILDPEASFTNIIIRMKNDKYKLVYFVDDAVAIKEIVDNFSKESDDSQEPPLDMVA